ncbi:class I SAM-dependent methyltransferase [Rathayibacter sp. CAU 1779]
MSDPREAGRRIPAGTSASASAPAPAPDPMHFDGRVDDYESARPPYPSALWETLRTHGLLQPGLRALDLGAGTGLATGPLLDAGLQVTAVEPGERLAERLRMRYPAASVVVSRAEDLDLPGASFDVVVAATAVHWFDLDIVLHIVERLLTPQGTFAVWRNVFGDPDVATPFRDRVETIVRRRASQPARRGALQPSRRLPDAENMDATAERLTRDGAFLVESATTYRWSMELDADRVERLFGTFSDWSQDEVAQAGAAVRELGGTVQEHYQSWLILVRPLRS